MLNKENIISARATLGKEIRENMKIMGTDEFHRLCVIAGELDILIKILKEKDDRNK